MEDGRLMRSDSRAAVAFAVIATVGFIALSAIGRGGIGAPEMGVLLALYLVLFATVEVRHARQA